MSILLRAHQSSVKLLNNSHNTIFATTGKRHLNLNTLDKTSSSLDPKALLGPTCKPIHAHPPPWTSDQLTQSRHLLRAILRESTYLPDPHSRKYISKHVLARFRDYTPLSKPIPLIEERRKEQLALARKTLSELRRGNAGEVKVVAKILNLTYGRTGKKRHELMAPFLVSESSSHPQSLPEDDSVPTTTPSKTPYTLPTLHPNLRALLSSQMRAQLPTLTRPAPRALSPKIPEKNSWQRPMPWLRVKNATEKWYATTLQRTLPPLSTSAWDELRDRALGKIPFNPVKRRKNVALVETHATTHHGVLEKELALIESKTPESLLSRIDETIRGKTMDQRFMQRRWAAVFSQCAKMDWDNKQEKWIITWGIDVLNLERKKKGSLGTPTILPQRQEQRVSKAKEIKSVKTKD